MGTQLTKAINVIQGRVKMACNTKKMLSTEKER